MPTRSSPPAGRAAIVITMALLAVYAAGATRSFRATVIQPPSLILGSCTKDDSDAFADLDFKEWAETYHGAVSDSIEEFIGERTSDKFSYRRPHNLQCDAEKFAQFLPAPDTVQIIASLLEPWEDLSTSPLSQEDIAPVLLEYLRVYECALVERKFSLPFLIAYEDIDEHEGMPGGLTANPYFYYDLFKETLQQQDDIKRELTIARPTLERTLGLVGSLSRLRPIESELECFQRASLDFRNAFGLAADASACLPRIWNAKDPLRDMPQCSDGYDNDDEGGTDMADDDCDFPSDASE